MGRVYTLVVRVREYSSVVLEQGCMLAAQELMCSSVDLQYRLAQECKSAVQAQGYSLADQVQE